MPNKIPTMIPYLTVQNANESIKFYETAFGFVTKEAIKGENGETTHAEMLYKDVLIMFAPEGAYSSPVKAPKTLNVLPSICLYLYCDDVDAMYQQALNARASSLMEPQDSFWGDRICQVSDLNGFQWMFAKPLANK